VAPGVMPGASRSPRRLGRQHAPRDGSLLNLRVRYLKLSLVEWFVFLASLACVPAAIRVAGATGDIENRSVFLALL